MAAQQARTKYISPNEIRREAKKKYKKSHEAENQVVAASGTERCRAQ
jgi:hypothetical protein